jgi:YD repeat-containing protein
VSYDPAGRIKTLPLGNGLTPTYTYYGWTDTATVDGQVMGQGGRLKTLVTGTLQNLEYKYDKVGNVKTITDSIASETQTYGYDALNRLTNATVTGGPAPYSESYDYDAQGNLWHKGSPSFVLSYNDAAHVHGVTDAGSNTYAYDENGNQDSRSLATGLDMGEYELKYDAENRLVEVYKNQNLLATFAYDGARSYDQFSRSLSWNSLPYISYFRVIASRRSRSLAAWQSRFGRKIP